ncbi:MAG: hypothetical protein U0175_17105 [Caldilineaceae bacterium]
MSQLAPIQPSTPPALNDFTDELKAVQVNLAQVFDTLYPPLLGLVRAQIQQAQPHLRAAVVLATAVAVDSADESVALRKKRIDLASALEMLYVALQVHELLLKSSAQELHDTIDKSVMGSTILAGDTCFSHAALLAARTDSPQVVAIFSQALQTISEKQLRHLFSQQDGKPSFDPSRELFEAGLQAASVLANLNTEVIAQLNEMIDTIPAQVLHSRLALSDASTKLDLVHQERWQALVAWYDQIKTR